MTNMKTKPFLLTLFILLQIILISSCKKHRETKQLCKEWKLSTESGRYSSDYVSNIVYHVQTLKTVLYNYSNGTKTAIEYDSLTYPIFGGSNNSYIKDTTTYDQIILQEETYEESIIFNKDGTFEFVKQNSTNSTQTTCNGSWEYLNNNLSKIKLTITNHSTTNNMGIPYENYNETELQFSNVEISKNNLTLTYKYTDSNMGQSSTSYFTTLTKTFTPK